MMTGSSLHGRAFLVGNARFYDAFRSLFLLLCRGATGA